MLKRKYYSDNKGVDYCAYYKDGEQAESDSGCLNENALDEKYSIL